MEAFAGVSTNKSRQAAIVLQRVTLTPPQRPAACRNGEGARGRKRTRVTSPRSCAFPSRLVCDVDVVSSLAATCFAKPRESLVKLRRTRDPGECLVTATSCPLRPYGVWSPGQVRNSGPQVSVPRQTGSSPWGSGLEAVGSTVICHHACRELLQKENRKVEHSSFFRPLFMVSGPFIVPLSLDGDSFCSEPFWRLLLGLTISLRHVWLLSTMGILRLAPAVPGLRAFSVWYSTSLFQYRLLALKSQSLGLLLGKPNLNHPLKISCCVLCALA
ncbi:uncharacterized protein LOC105300352 isoform X1 [Pteropus vampyrus]|uniref:Uncharacterized protein LOC105300352 isoform X1 n=1 Tax=Pteropus vampyrus TaxID=132908 RepID=A0A6P6D1Z2_PTEVA|nr:uncharacterized protein LOC105300352 isoform X1 [Pteropus vampyrus]